MRHTCKEMQEIFDYRDPVPSDSIMKRKEDKRWYISVGTGDYHVPIRYCPFCGKKLR